MSTNVPFPGIVDIRQPILGDSFGWAGLEPTAAKKSLMIHHSASPNNQDGFDIAAYHVNSNGWNGVGYHFVITSDDYPGRAGFTPPGAQVQYVGDLGTWRAHVANDNPGRVGICLVGNFVTGYPGRRQLELARQLIDFFMASNNVLPSIKYYSQVIGHGLLPGQQTACPGYSNPHFTDWFGYLQGSGFPYNLHPEALPAPPEPYPPVPTTPETPVGSDLTPGKGGAVITLDPNDPSNTLSPPPAYRAAPSKRVVAREGAHGVDVVTGVTTVPDIPVGKEIDVAGYFLVGGKTYARTEYSAAHATMNGLDVTYFDAPTGQTNGDIPVQTPPVPNPADDVLVIAPDPETPPATTVFPATEPSKLSLWQLIIEWVARVSAAYIAKRKKKS